MHFCKTYSELLLTLSPELRKNAIEYRQLKKLINEVVLELDSFGLSPKVLQLLLEEGAQDHVFHTGSEEWDASSSSGDSSHSSVHAHLHPTVIYEIESKSASGFEPRLRISFGHDAAVSDTNTAVLSADQVKHIVDAAVHPLAHLQTTDEDTAMPPSSDYLEPSDTGQDLIIPLRSDTAFLCLLTSALSSLSGHFSNLHGEFKSSLGSLAVSISSNARPVSSSSPHSFAAYLLSTGNVASVRPGLVGKSDLYFWREVFQLYVEAEIFEDIGEVHRGERSVEEAERRLVLFSQRVAGKGGSSRLSGSKEALEVFFKINAFILDVKKFQLATAEAIRKILKKHTKRTALLIPAHLLSASGDTPSSEVVLAARPLIPLQRLLVQAIGEVLLPVVPHIDDYSCLICTSIAFKPVKLDCGHLFCVRCLVKLQKRGKADCPLCRAPTVLTANRANVDYALLNFMSDWFPVESREKLRANEREAAQEELEELGFQTRPGCIIM
ncbi:hypothetical protein SCLCIDRAFT_1220249 [Scleroderma citrinum Foug A]|uniref:RING-type domain-containing protein n=1 Tax=Scleroderma citrinum Foug A TaxID=1036808 RepID=A0A0C2ZVP5_9AGAM|nr:hypothetical protein SCLCIDRAFT_1220249 [Scleroderma citrinum Foug A]